MIPIQTMTPGGRLMHFGTVTSAAFVPGHTTVLLPLICYLSAYNGVTAGIVVLKERTNRKVKVDCRYYFRLMQNLSFEVASEPHPGTNYGKEPLEIPQRILDLLYAGKALPDPIQDREGDRIIQTIAKNVGGEITAHRTVRIEVDGVPYDCILKEAP